MSHEKRTPDSLTGSGFEKRGGYPSSLKVPKALPKVDKKPAPGAKVAPTGSASPPAATG